MMTAGNDESEGQEAVRKIKEETVNEKGMILYAFVKQLLLIPHGNFLPEVQSNPFPWYLCANK